jgi:16S rRNA G966 N2-methylase RsmD
LRLLSTLVALAVAGVEKYFASDVISNMKKPCPGCGETDLTKFRLMKGKYYPPKCQECERNSARENRKARYHDPATQSIIKAQNKAFHLKPERIEIDKARNRAHYISNSTKIKANVRAYRQVPENKARRNFLWRERYNLERDDRRADFKRRYHEDPEFRLRGNTRSRVWEALKMNGGSKESSILRALDYSLEHLKFHVESQFSHGMGWNDSKSFSLDHIIPQSMFHYSSLDDPEFKLCWALDNLRPLPYSQNFSEGDRRHLFGGHTSWQSLASGIRSWPLGSLPENLQEVRHLLSCGELRPGLGLGFLDELFPHRFDSKTRGKPSLREAIADDHFLLKIVAYIIGSGRPVTQSAFYRNAAFLNKTPSHFLPSFAASLVKEFAPGGSVIDPFLGWGGRTLGAICAGATSFCGTDLQYKSVVGCREIARRLGSNDVEFVCSDFSEYLSETSRSFDLLLTSPPFAGTEDYGTGIISMESWIPKILQPLVSGAARVVRPGGYIAVHGQDRPSSPILSAIRAGFATSKMEQIVELPYGRSGQSIIVYRR